MKAQEISQWQPIETVPRDGRYINVRGRVYDTLGHDTAGTIREGKSRWRTEAGGFWEFRYPGWVGTIHPTHWQPLPKGICG